MIYQTLRDLKRTRPTVSIILAESRAERASMRGIEESAYPRNSPLWARASYVNREEYPCRYVLHKEEPMVTRAYTALCRLQWTVT